MASEHQPVRGGGGLPPPSSTALQLHCPPPSFSVLDCSMSWQSPRSLEQPSELEVRRLEAQLEEARQEAQHSQHREEQLKGECEQLQAELKQLQETRAQVSEVAGHHGVTYCVGRGPHLFWGYVEKGQPWICQETITGCLHTAFSSLPAHPACLACLATWPARYQILPCLTLAKSGASSVTLMMVQSSSVTRVG